MPRTRSYLLVFALILGAGCAEEQALLSQEAAAFEAPTSWALDQTRLPEHLVDVLGADGVFVEAADFDDGLSAEETLRRFNQTYGGPRYEGKISVFALHVIASSSSRMPPGSAVRMVYVPDVPLAFEGVAPPPGARESSWEPPPAHMFAFFDSETGRLVETTHIAMEN